MSTKTNRPIFKYVQKGSIDTVNYLIEALGLFQRPQKRLLGIYHGYPGADGFAMKGNR
jgi:hypothetical protein